MWTWLRPSFSIWAAAAAVSLVGVSRTTTPPVPAQYRAEAVRIEANWSAEQSALGKRLFKDRGLSRDRSIACVDCHDPQLAYTDGKARSVGIRGQVMRRNSPTLVNLALGRSQGWDGRTTNLEAFVLGPIQNPLVMDLPIEEAVRRVQADKSYRKAFQRVFGGGPTRERLAMALAAYHRSIYSVDAPFDRYVAGDPQALTPEAQRGLALFVGKARCGECHSGSGFTDESYHTLGIGDDPGRGTVTRSSADFGAFKTPSLREVGITAPYMHDGSLATLADVVDYYDRGGDPHPNLDPRMRRLGLTDGEKAALVAFMESLTGTVLQDGVPVDSAR